MPNDPAYQPISCAFHDLLEASATTRKPALIRWRDDNGDVRHVSATITDVYARGGAEYVALSSGETLRLDRLVEIDKAKLADF